MRRGGAAAERREEIGRGADPRARRTDSERGRRRETVARQDAIRSSKWRGRGSPMMIDGTVGREEDEAKRSTDEERVSARRDGIGASERRRRRRPMIRSSMGEDEAKQPPGDERAAGGT
ncbi:unnamed protein product [Urochloa humidicola]